MEKEEVLEAKERMDSTPFEEGREGKRREGGEGEEREKEGTSCLLIFLLLLSS